MDNRDGNEKQTTDRRQNGQRTDGVKTNAMQVNFVRNAIQILNK